MFKVLYPKLLLQNTFYVYTCMLDKLMDDIS